MGRISEQVSRSGIGGEVYSATEMLRLHPDLTVNTLPTGYWE